MYTPSILFFYCISPVLSLDRHCRVLFYLQLARILGNCIIHQGARDSVVQCLGTARLSINHPILISYASIWGQRGNRPLLHLSIFDFLQSF